MKFIIIDIINQTQEVWKEDVIQNFLSSQSFCFIKAQKRQDKHILFERLSRKIFIMDNKALKMYGSKMIGKIHLLPSSDIKKETAEFAVFNPIITTGCHLNCTYCYGAADKRKAENNSWKILKAAIDYISKNNQEINLNLSTPGEQIFNFKLFKKTINYINFKLKLKHFSFSTSGILSDSQLNWIVNNIPVLQVSCDGPPDIQDAQRPLKNGGKSSTYVEKTIKFLIQHKKNFQVKITLTNNAVNKEERIFKYFYNLNVPIIDIMGVFSFGNGIKYTQLYSTRMIQKNTKSALKIKEWGDNFNMNTRLQFGLGIFNLNNQNLPQCAAGDHFTIGPDGTIFGCGLLASKEDVKIHKSIINKFIIGKYDKTTNKILINHNKVKALKTIKIKMLKKAKECKKCSISPCSALMNSSCPLSNYQFTPDNMYLPTKETCVQKNTEILVLVEYFIDQYAVKLKPRLEIKNNNLYYVLLMSQFKMAEIKSGEKLKDNSFIRLNIDNINYIDIIKNILNWHNADNKKIKVLLISFIQNKEININDFNILQIFIESLQKHRIIFKFTKPIKIADIKLDKKSCEQLRIPANCYECLEMFIVDKDRVRFCNNRLGPKIKQVFSRDELYKLFQKSTMSCPPKCLAFDALSSTNIF